MGLRRRAGSVLTAALMVVLLLGLLWWLDAPRATEPPVPQDTVAGSALSPQCTPSKPFQPAQAVITGFTATVVGLHRDANNVPGVPPLTVGGKSMMAWDLPPKGALPGSTRGNVLLNTHTWPDGSALGNRMLERLHVGDVFELRGKAGERLCYRITERVEVRAADGYPRYYQDTGTPQAALIVCSGERLGPDNWTHRTIWFAAPVDSPGAAGA